MRRILVGVVAALALLIAPAAANASWHAELVEIENEPWLAVDVTGTVYVTLTQVGTTPQVEVGGGGITDIGVGTVGDGCAQAQAGTGICAVDFAGVVVYGSPGADTINLRLDDISGVPLAGAVLAGAGNDSINASSNYSAADAEGMFLDGEAGNDTIAGTKGPDALDGGEGDDKLFGDAGDDALDGGAGNDGLAGGEGADTHAGGPGRDNLRSGDYKEFDRGGADVSITLDGAANDGEPGEGDNVHADIEDIAVDGGAVTVVGTDAPESFQISARSGSVDARGGDDQLSVTAGSGFTANGGAGADQISVGGTDGTVADGGPGNDRLVGQDSGETLLGGDGDDFLQGGFGSDVLDGGPGRDEFVGDQIARNAIGYGNDRIRARDGIAEPVDCGVGADSAEVDTADVVDATCESVDRAGVAQVVPPNPPWADPGPPKGPELTLAKVTSIRALIKSGVTMTQRCAAACRVTADLVVDKRTAKRLGLRANRALGSASASLRGPGATTLTVNVSPSVKRKLKRMQKLTVTLRVRVGNETTTRTLTLKR